MGWDILGIIIFVAGYVLAIYTWPTIRGWFVSVEAEIARLQKAIDVLRGKGGS